MPKAKRSPTPEEFALPELPPTPASPQPARAKRFATGKASSKRRRDEPGERLVLSVPTDLAQRLRVRCAHERCSLSHAAAEALEAWLSRS